MTFIHHLIAKSNDGRGVDVKTVRIHQKTWLSSKKFEELAIVNTQADEAGETLRISIDAKNTVDVDNV